MQLCPTVPLKGPEGTPPPEAILTPPLKKGCKGPRCPSFLLLTLKAEKNFRLRRKCLCFSPSVCGHKQNIGKNVLLIVANVQFSYIFCLFVLPYENREKIFEGTPPWPPPVLKNQAPPAEKKIGPPPLGFWSSPTYDRVGGG